MTEDFPTRVKGIGAVLYREPEVLKEGLAALAEGLGEMDVQGKPYLFHHTDYYAEEMGTPLNRLLVSFHALMGADTLAATKHAATELEGAFRIAGKRSLNFDVGYLDLFKVVLASNKGRGNKIYLGQQVWADLTLTYAKGAYHSMPWTFADFREASCHETLKRIRQVYKTQLAEEI